MTADFPPLAVPLTGPAPDPSISARWVTYSAGKIGEPAEAIWLDHLYPTSATKLQVANLPRHRYDEVWAGWDVLDAIAFQALLTLTGFTRPTPGLNVANARLQTFIEAQSEQWREWPTAPLHLHGAPVRCPIAQFAGSWVALVEDDPDSHLIILGRGQDPTDVELVRVATEAYGFAADDPVPFGTAGPRESEQTYKAELAPPHPDWTPFIDHGPVRAYPGDPRP